MRFLFNENSGLKFRISHVQWNVTFRLQRPDPSYRAFGYYSCKQDTKERYWGQQFCQRERDISVRPTEMTRPVKVAHLQSWSGIFRLDQTRNGLLHLMYQPNFRDFGLKHKRLFTRWRHFTITTRILNFKKLLSCAN